MSRSGLHVKTDPFIQRGRLRSPRPLARPGDDIWRRRGSLGSFAPLRMTIGVNLFAIQPLICYTYTQDM